MSGSKGAGLEFYSMTFRSPFKSEYFTHCPSNAPKLTKMPSKIHDEKAEVAFKEWYLAQLTREFADDLDKLRSAPDWRESTATSNGSLEILMHFLEQKVSTFDKEDRIRIGKGLMAAEQNGHTP